MISRIWTLLFLSYSAVVDGFLQTQPISGDNNGSESAIMTTSTATTTAPQLLFQADMPAELRPENSNAACKVFDTPRNISVGDKQIFEFYSPGYPGEYPNDTDCKMVIEAQPGYVIRLDFREFFRLENSTNCKHDSLEVRDGPRGYDTIIKHPFCGTVFPPELQSKDRHLWIRFKSDKTIEDKGFKAVYEFVPRSPKVTTPERMPCDMRHESKIEEFPDVEGFLYSEQIDKDYLNWTSFYKMPIDCLWNITVPKNWKVQLQFESFSLENANSCESNFLDVFSDTTDEDGRDKTFCGSIADAISSKHNVMFVRFYADSNSRESHFRANFTAYRDLSEKPRDQQKCEDGELDCDDKTCIAKILECNNRYNCRFRFDEENCPNVQGSPFGSDHIIIIMVVFTLILSGMCFTFVYNCAKKLCRDRAEIKEYIRKSQEEITELDKIDGILLDSKHPPPPPHSHHLHHLSRSRSTSSPSSPHRCETTTVNATVNAPCYVPGGDILPILIRPERSVSPPADVIYDNGGDDDDVIPEMCDTACQTRESLFTTQGYSSTHSSPKGSSGVNSSVGGVSTSPTTVPFSTFGYKKDDSSGKYRAEAKIDVVGERKRRPYSVQTTKSAPDVIVTH